MSLELEKGWVTAVGPPVAIRLAGDTDGYTVPVYGTSLDWVPFVGQEVGVLVDVVGSRRTRVACIGARLTSIGI